MRMALLRNHLTSYILKQSLWMLLLFTMRTKGWLGLVHIINAVAAVIDGRYDAVCGNGIIAQAQQDRFIHRDLLAGGGPISKISLRVVSSSRRRRVLPPKPTVCMIVAGGASRRASVV